MGQKPIELKPVDVEGGKVLGVLTADQQVVAFKGIPFAAPPVAELRWQAPQPVPKWKHVLHAEDFGPHCIQFGTWPDMVFHDAGPSEDCLTLNVWAPADARAAKKSTGLPVMVWIYGGGFTTGGTSENRQNGEFLAHRGVIVVSMNYRLGIFGFFAHPELTTESSVHASGNYGLMDQAAAIAWVKRNIGAFGGDPANITIFGQSAGGSSVTALIASPVTRGLFAKAIGQSGAAFYSSNYQDRQDREQVNVSWAERAFGTSKMFYLRNIATDDVVREVMRGNAPNFGPVIDGYFLPDTVPHIYADGKQAHIPVLGGWVANERPPVPTATAASFTAQAGQLGANAAAFLALYPAKTDAEAVKSATDYATDSAAGFPTWSWLEAQTKTSGAPVYRYLFALGSPGDRNHTVSQGAFHSDDIEYEFGALESRPEMKIRPEDRKLSEQIQAYWTNFAKTGDPNGPGLPQWPAYSAQTGWQVMRLDATSEAKPDGMRARYLFLDSQWGKAAGK
jgi:para-nitrobenzyl esterase